MQSGHEKAADEQRARAQQLAHGAAPPATEREARGARKRARAQHTQARRVANRHLAAQLSVPPTSATQAAHRWDVLYQSKPTQFKDRHLLRAAFPELVAPHVAANPATHVPPLEPPPSPLPQLCAPSAACDRVLVEAGCGAGNAVFPLLRANARLFAFAFDFSAAAVALVQSSPEYRRDRIIAFQADLTVSHTYSRFIRTRYPSGVHFVTVLWTLSALTPSQHPIVATALAALLAGGGHLFIRDYAVGDMRHKRFAQRAQRVHNLPENLYLRGDGTYAYFFSKEHLTRLFEAQGLTCVSCHYEHRVVNNRKTQSTMRRRWVQAKFRKP
ncbi:unnamed protein product [Agarophyton chilense]